jgi:hypothetical protein
MSIKFVREWYSYIPEFETERYARFVGQSGALAQRIAGRKIVITIREKPTAHVEHGDPARIVMPRWYLSRKELTNHFPAFLKDPEAYGVGFFNGTICHESLHLVHSLETIQEMAELEPRFGKLTQLKSMCLNVTEDIYIDTMGGYEYYGKFIHIKNAILFSRESFRKADEPNRFIHCKNPAHRKSVPANWRKLIHKMTQAHLKVERARLAYEMYLLLEHHEDNEEADGSESFTGQDGDLDSIQVSPTDVDDNVCLEVEMASEEGDVEAVVLDVTEVAAPGGFIEPDPAFAEIGKQLRIKRTLSSAPKAPSVRGKLRRNRLHRIATDGKVCGQATPVLTPPKTEIKILVDASGSMNWGQLYGKVLRAGFGMFESFKAARIQVEVLIHTSMDDSSDTPFVAIVANERSANPRARFATALNVDNCNNYDGYAIRETAKRFGQSPRRLLFVLSDGQPAGRYYMDSDEDTKKAVQETRDKGISVVAVSLVRGVVEANNMIYGINRNIDASRDISEQLAQLTLSI